MGEEESCQQRGATEGPRQCLASSTPPNLARWAHCGLWDSSAGSAPVWLRSQLLDYKGSLGQDRTVRAGVPSSAPWTTLQIGALSSALGMKTFLKEQDQWLRLQCEVIKTLRPLILSEKTFWNKTDKHTRVLKELFACCHPPSPSRVQVVTVPAGGGGVPLTGS